MSKLALWECFVMCIKNSTIHLVQRKHMRKSKVKSMTWLKDVKVVKYQEMLSRMLHAKLNLINEMFLKVTQVIQSSMHLTASLICWPVNTGHGLYMEMWPWLYFPVPSDPCSRAPWRSLKKTTHTEQLLALVCSSNCWPSYPPAVGRLDAQWPLTIWLQGRLQHKPVLLVCHGGGIIFCQEGVPLYHHSTWLH